MGVATAVAWSSPRLQRSLNRNHFLVNMFVVSMQSVTTVAYCSPVFCVCDTAIISRQCSRLVKISSVCSTNSSKNSFSFFWSPLYTVDYLSALNFCVTFMLAKETNWQNDRCASVLGSLTWVVSKYTLCPEKKTKIIFTTNQLWKRSVLTSLFM